MSAATLATVRIFASCRVIYNQALISIPMHIEKIALALYYANCYENCIKKIIQVIL